MADKKIYYNHAYDLGFTVFTESADDDGVTREELLTGLLRRVSCLIGDPEELKEACGCYDPMDEEQSQEDYDKWKSEFQFSTVVETQEGTVVSARTLPSDKADILFKELAHANGAGEYEVDDILNQQGQFSEGDYTVGIVKSKFE